MTTESIARELVAHVDSCADYIDTGDILDYVNRLRETLGPVETALCGICDHAFGEHYSTHDGSFDGCATCADCEGFGIPS